MKGIGTYKERSLHYTLKNIIEPDTSLQEVRYKGFIADIKRGNEIFEIQTRSFNTMRKKLSAFLCENDVTVVFPIAREKQIVWIDPETGEASEKRKSPKRGNIFQVLPELYKIKMFLREPNLHFKLVLTDLVEYRTADGWSEDGKKGSTRYESIPTEFAEAVDIKSQNDYIKLVPSDLEPEFTAHDFSKKSKLSHKKAQSAVNVLRYVGILEVVGKKSNAYVYSVASELKPKERQLDL